MKTILVQKIYLAFVVLCAIALSSQQTFSQTENSVGAADSLSSTGALQFQLLGGVGLYYISDDGPTSHSRIGADVYLKHSDQSGSGDSYSTSSYTPPSSSDRQGYTNQPEQISDSYGISLSVVYLRNSAKHNSLYVGAGPLAAYSWDREINNYLSTPAPGTSSSSSSNTSRENTNKTLGIGAIGIFGVRSRVFSHVSLSAEIGLSALYQWTTETISYTSAFTYPSNANTTTYNDGSTTHLKGWAVSLSSIRIGVIIEL